MSLKKHKINPEILTVIVLGVIAIVAMVILQNESQQIATAIAGGLVGYLAKDIQQ